MSTVDDLFGGAGPAAPVHAGEARKIRRWLVAAGVLTLLGPTCFTGVPGAGIAIWCWHVAEEAVQRVDNGVAPPEEGPPLRRLKRAAFALLVISTVSLLGQVGLFVTGFYSLVWMLLMGESEFIMVSP